MTARDQTLSSPPPATFPRRILRAAAVLVASGFLLTACAGGNPPASPTPVITGSDAENASEIQSIIDRVRDETNIPGAAVYVSSGGTGRLYLSGESNTDESLPVEGDDIFGYRSVTKSLVVTVILQLVESGDVSLDDTIGTYVEGVPNGDTITLRQLAAMQSGLVNYSTAPQFVAALQEDPLQVVTTQQLLDWAYAEPVSFAPGASYEYSNTNTLLLGEVVEKVTGQPWNVAVGTDILDALQLESVTYPGDSGLLPEPSAVGYLVDDEGVEAAPPIPLSGFGAAGGLVGTVMDLATYGHALAAGGLVTPELQQERVANAVDPSVDPNSPEYDAYGLGIGELDGWWGHTGYGLGFSVLTMGDPTTDDVVAIVMNGSPEDHDVPAALFRELLPLVR